MNTNALATSTAMEKPRVAKVSPTGPPGEGVLRLFNSAIPERTASLTYAMENDPVGPLGIQRDTIQTGQNLEQQLSVSIPESA